MTMNALLRGFGLAGLLLVASASTLAAEESTATSQCTGFRFNLDSELKLFAGTPREINAASTATAPTAIDGATLYRVALVDQSAARFAIPPGKPTVADGSYAGLLRITPTGSSTLRVNLGEAAWIDVVAGGRELESARHTGSHDCTPAQERRILRPAWHGAADPDQWQYRARDAARGYVLGALM